MHLWWNIAKHCGFVLPRSRQIVFSRCSLWWAQRKDPRPDMFGKWQPEVVCYVLYLFWIFSIICYISWFELNLFYRLNWYHLPICNLKNCSDLQILLSFMGMIKFTSWKPPRFASYRHSWIEWGSKEWIADLVLCWRRDKIKILSVIFIPQKNRRFFKQEKKHQHENVMILIGQLQLQASTCGGDTWTLHEKAAVVGPCGAVECFRCVHLC